MDAVGADQHIGRDRFPVLEMRFDGVAAIDQVREAVREMHALRRNRVGDRAMQVGPMERVVRRAESPLDHLAERGTQQEAAVVPPALIERHRPDAGARQRLADA